MLPQYNPHGVVGREIHVWDPWSQPGRGNLSGTSAYLWQSSFDAVLVVEDSSPTCPAELGKGLLAFIRVLAANMVLCLFIGT